VTGTNAPKGRIIALDVGSVRIGVAITDPIGIFAQGLTVLQAKGDWVADLAALVEQNGVSAILIGMPRRTDGSLGPEAGKMKKVADRLSSRFPNLEVIAWDERFTTTMAQAALIEANVSRKNRKKSVDKVAATLLLQNYLDFTHRS
jgi:putative Holliday junction resolvase